MHCCPDDSDSVDDQKPKIRQCTDVIWLCVFLLFWVFMILVAAFAFVYGNPLRLINGYDTFGNVCDSEDNEKFGDFSFSGTEMSQKKYLFFMDFDNVRHSMQICVKHCPDRDLKTLADVQDFYDRTGSSLCWYDFDMTHLSKANISVTSPFGPCPKLPIYKSVPILNRCVPEITKDLGIYLINESWNLVEELFGDLYRSWKWILYLTMFSVVLSVIVIYVLYFFAGFVSVILMFAAGAACIAGTAVLWWTYFSIKCKLDSDPSDYLLIKEVNNEEAFKWAAIVATVVSLLVLLLIFATRKRVSFLVALFQEASNCLSELPSLYLQPIFTFSLLLLFYAFWISVVICLATASYPESKRLKSSSVRPTASPHYSRGLNDVESSIDVVSIGAPKNVVVGEWMTFTAVQYIESTWLKYMVLLYLIGLIWISEFTLACQHMIVAGSVAKWYFYRGRKSSSSVVLTSVGNLICYHLGSVALGALLITIFKIPRILLNYVYYKLRRKKEESQSAKCCLKCGSCCFYSLEKFIRYMNHNAYTVVSIQGINFCPAAYRAWKVLVDNALRLATVNSIGDLILFLGKCFVAVTTASFAVIIFKYDSSLKFYAGPSLMVLVFAYFVSHAIISLYESVIDTLFLCICEDQRMNGNEGLWRTTLLANIGCSGVKRHQEESQPTEL